MVGYRAAAAALVVVMAAILAGCSGGGPAPDEGDDGFAGLEATSSTGVLRGVVVDGAIRPVPGVLIQVQRLGTTLRDNVTDVEGRWGFGGLEPGQYTIVARKPGYFEQVVQASVVAGVNAPDLVRIGIDLDVENQPFFTEFKWNGYAQCIIPGANVCAIINLYPCALAGYCEGIVNDDSFVWMYEPMVAQKRIPDFVSLETFWDATQPLGEKLTIRYGSSDPETFSNLGWICLFGSETSASPLIYQIGDNDCKDDSLFGVESGLTIEFFQGGNDILPAPLDSYNVVLEQDFEMFFFMFYGYRPADGWTFADTGEAPPA